MEKSETGSYIVLLHEGTDPKPVLEEIAKIGKVIDSMAIIECYLVDTETPDELSKISGVKTVSREKIYTINNPKSIKSTNET